jgi:hypothetical protein
MFSEVTHVLDTQLIPSATPSKPERPHFILRVVNERCSMLHVFLSAHTHGVKLSRRRGAQPGETER